MTSAVIDTIITGEEFNALDLCVATATSVLDTMVDLNPLVGSTVNGLVKALYSYTNEKDIELAIVKGWCAFSGSWISISSLIDLKLPDNLLQTDLDKFIKTVAKVPFDVGANAKSTIVTEHVVAEKKKIKYRCYTRDFYKDRERF